MDTTNLKVWLPFDRSTTTDLCGNSWTAYGTPTIDEAGAINGSALQLTTAGQYLSMGGGITLGGQDFTICGEFNMDSSSSKWCRVFCMFSTSESEADAIRVARNDNNSKLNVGCLNVTNTCAVSFGTVHHYELDYHHSTGTTDFFLDGAKQFTITQAIPRMAFPNVWLGKSNFSADGAFIGTLDNFMIFDGIALHSEDFTPPTAAEYAAMSAPATATFDVEVRYTNRSEVGCWRYENPGSGDYIYYHDNITTEEVGYDTSVTGVAFWGGDKSDMVGVPTGCKELWLRFDLFLKSSITGGDNTTSFSMGSTSNASGALSIAGYANLVWTLPEKSGWSLCIGNTMYFTLTPGARNAILIYLKSGRTDGIVEGTVGAQTSRYIGNVNNGNDFDNVFFQSSQAAAMFSNIVVSNAPLTLEDGWHREPVAVEMNIKAPDLCVRKNGTTYTVPFATTQDPPANSVVARLGGQMVYNPLVATDNANASVIKTRYNGNNRALSASFG